jgi:hypothetical protein
MTPAGLAALVGADALGRWSAAPRDELAGLGRRLQALGLTERALAHCFGVRCPMHAPLSPRAADERTNIVPAAIMARLWVAGSSVPVDSARARLGADFERLCELSLLAREGEHVRATVAIVPVARQGGEALVVSDRADVRTGRGIAMFADDSAFHTLGAVPARAARPGLSWLDVGTGSAIVPLARPGAAARVVGTDINPRAIAMAELGAALSGVSHLELAVADLLDAAERSAPWDRITFNAPIPASDASLQARPDQPWYRCGAADILQRFWAGVRDLVAPGGEVLVHSRLPGAAYPASLDVPGCVIVLEYTPPGQPAFGITWWRPDAPARRARIAVALTAEAPHVTRAALEGAAEDRDSRTGISGRELLDPD